MISSVSSSAHLVVQPTKGQEKAALAPSNEVKETEKTKAQEIKERIQNGTYKVDLQKTAEGMVSFLLK